MTKTRQKTHYTYISREPRYTRYYTKRYWNRHEKHYDYVTEQLPPHLQHYDKTDYRYVRQQRESAKQKRLSAADAKKQDWISHQKFLHHQRTVRKGYTPMTWLQYTRKKTAKQDASVAKYLQRSFHKRPDTHKRSGKIAYRFVKYK
nr:hypothetical protein [Crucivirus sp.]